MERDQEEEAAAGTPPLAVAEAQPVLTGRRARADTRHPAYRGIRYRAGKWVSEIREPRKSSRIWLGTYPAPEMAAAAYDAAALALRGAEAALNFPGAALARPAPASRSPEDIRSAAAAAAAAAATAPCPGERVHSQRSAAAGVHGARDDGHIVDEDDVFQAPRLLAGMAEGLMMSPPPTTAGDDDDADGVVCLWDHS